MYWGLLWGPLLLETLVWFTRGFTWQVRLDLHDSGTVLYGAVFSDLRPRSKLMSLTTSPKRPHKHMDPTGDGFWNPPLIGPQSPLIGSVCFCGLSLAAATELRRFPASPSFLHCARRKESRLSHIISVPGGRMPKLQARRTTAKACDCCNFRCSTMYPTTFLDEKKAGLSLASASSLEYTARTRDCNKVLMEKAS